MTATNDPPRSLTLYQLDDELLQVLALLEETDNNDPPTADLEQRLCELDDLIARKTDGYVGLIRSLDAVADRSADEAKHFADRSRAIGRQADRLRERLVVHMKITGQGRIDTGRFTLTMRANPPSVNVVDAAAVPRMYEREKITIDVDKRSILADFKATGAIPPGVTIERGTRLEIR